MEKKYHSFAEFWPFYLSQHSNRTCRILHAFGTTLGIVLLIYAVATQHFELIPICFVFGYGFSWIGHFFFEKNRPATFTYPKWSFLGDFVMLKYFYIGKLDSELQKYNIVDT